MTETPTPVVEFKHMGYASDEQVERYQRRFAGIRCWSCRFFDESEPLTWDEYIFDGKSHGERFNLDGYCRRHCPQPGIDEETGDMEAKWPWVNGYDWCGERQEIEKAAE